MGLYVHFHQEAFGTGEKEMIIAEIIRLEESEHGTIGILRLNKEVFCMTLEPPDRENKRNVSSIPTGQYVCKHRISRRFGEVFEVLDVSDRSDILFHKGNIVDHTAGCIILGEHIGKLRGSERAVLNSGWTFKKFMDLLSTSKTFHLTIKEDY